MVPMHECSMILPSATYRVQLRNGLDFARLGQQIGALADLGVSHLYLSPVFTAVQGSTHGYDITRPDQVDPGLGGVQGLRDLAQAAQARGLGLILDIVPNHTAFSLENPWLWDVLRHGSNSRYAGYFDIDWAAGPLALPFLPEALQLMKDAGLLVADWAAPQPVLAVADLFTLPLSGDASDDLDAVLARQHWRLMHWERERDSITHRRFFNVTGLIGMRVENRAVFDAMHATTLDLLRDGTVQGLRIDHIDGLADPAGYLARLRAAVGPDVPIWVEKILTGDERLPDWPVQGTTGYEHAADIARVLTHPAGHAQIDALWRKATDVTGKFHAEVLRAKTDILRNELAAELGALQDRAGAVVASDPTLEAGPEALREAVIALIEEMDSYRTYVTGGHATPDDRARLALVANRARQRVRSEAVITRLEQALSDPTLAPDRRFATRFQQISGALLAKAHEDTAAFRWAAYLASSEVGANPDQPTTDPVEFSARFAQIAPGAMILTSSHDTKRSEDARMRLVALSHLPDDWAALWAQTSAALPSDGQPPQANRLWYLLQTLLAAFHPTDPDLGQRVADHMVKALREAKEITTPTHPVPEAEAAYVTLALLLAAQWQADLPPAAARLIAQGAVLSLAQVGLKLLSTGVPDIYQGCEVGAFTLTDPDNRQPVDPGRLQSMAEDGGFDGRKLRLTRALLALRRRAPDLFVQGRSLQMLWRDGGVTLTATGAQGGVTLTIPAQGDAMIAVLPAP